MGERLLCKQEVIGSIPFTSTTGAVGCAERPAWQGQAEGYGRNAASDDVRRRTREIPFWGVV